MATRRKLDRLKKRSANPVSAALAAELFRSVEQARAQRVPAMYSRSNAHRQILDELERRFYANPDWLKGGDIFRREVAEWKSPWQSPPCVAAKEPKGYHHLFNSYEERPRDFNPAKVRSEHRRNEAAAKKINDEIEQKHFDNPLKITMVREGVAFAPADCPGANRSLGSKV